VLLVRADANAQVGVGHVMRCIALAQAWQDAGGAAVFLMASGAPGVEQRVCSEGMKMQILRASAGTLADASELAALSKKVNADWVVVDGYHFSTEYQQLLRQEGVHFLVLDDLALLTYYCGDIIVNPNPTAENLRYPCSSRTRLLLGTQYALLRRDFRNCRAIPHRRDRHPSNVLITMGGADPDNVTCMVLQALAQLPAADVEVAVVVGPNNPWEREIRDLAGRLHLKTAVHYDASNMVGLMAEADLCVTAGGGTCWEIACVGVPMLIATLAENQVSSVEALTKVGCAISLGAVDTLTTPVITSAVWNLLCDDERRRHMMDKGRGLVDGKGVTRIVERMKSLDQISAAVS